MKRSESDSSEEFHELFKLFGNDVRRKIVQALWEEFTFDEYVTETREGMQFGELRKQAGIRDSGNFNYHLKKLHGVLVDKTAAGYVLSPLGYNLMRSIDRLTTFEYETVSEQELRQPCPYCEGTLTGEYRREILRITCQDCDGLAEAGWFTSIEIPATGGVESTLDEQLDRAVLTMFSRVKHSRHGTCWDCLTPIESDVTVCEDHARGPGGTCNSCNHRYASLIEVSCPTCGNAGRGPLVEYAIIHPVTRGFFDQLGRGPADVGPWQYRLQGLESSTEQVAARDPTATAFTFEFQDERLEVTVQEREQGLALEADARVEPAPRD